MISENESDYKKAIEAYEKMIVEECEDELPFERLMIIYKKLIREEQEIEIIAKAIQYFSDLKNKSERVCIKLGS